MSERYIAIRNWERFQNRDVWRKSNGCPPWIKAYTALLHDDDWMELSHSQRGILLGLWLMYASAGRSISETGARRRLSRSDAEARHWRDNLLALNHAGFIEFVSREIRAPIAPRVEESREEPPLPPLPGGNGHSPRVSVKGYTGCRLVRGSHGAAHVYDPLGRDARPPDWPYDTPSRDVIRQALAEKEAASVAVAVDSDDDIPF